MASALESPRPHAPQWKDWVTGPWLPVKSKVWSSTSGALGGVVAGLLFLGRPLAELTEEGMCAFATCPSAHGVDNLEKVYVVLLTVAATWIGGYVKPERKKI